MLSNINYFSKSGEETDSNEVSFGRQRHSTFNSADHTTKSLNYDRTESDSTSTQCFQMSESLKNFAPKKGSLSDTDILAVNGGYTKKRKCKKLKLDIKQGSQSMTESINIYNDNSSNCVENTPKHILLDCKSAEAFSERLKKFDFDKSFDFSETISVCSSYDDGDVDLDSISNHTDSDLSNDGTTVKMCRKVVVSEDIPSTTPESFGDVEDKNEGERINLLLNYKVKLGKIEYLLQKLLNEFQFHIEVSKIFNSKSIVTTLPFSNVSSNQKIGELKQIDNMTRGVSPSWNIVMEKEDTLAKAKLKKQLLSIKEITEKFVNTHLDNTKSRERRYSYPKRDELVKSEHVSKQNKIIHKKKLKYFDFPDLREAMINLFGSESDKEDLSISGNNITNLLSDLDDQDSQRCSCTCHVQADSGLTTKTDQSDQSITSSIGNFTLDSTTLSAYSESLDMMVSYNSFQDTSLYSTLLQKSAIERISFYVQVHSVQLKCELAGQDSKANVIMFHCSSCNITEREENGLLRHILSQEHCERIHFVYKTAYIKKCMSSGKEIMPSTVLNPMVMYRDDNKIVCFGDAMYACTLCFENLIVGESVLMAHCSSMQHVCRRERLSDIIG